MDLLSNTRHLYPLGRYCTLSGKAVFYDFGFRNNRRVPARDYFIAHSLCQSKISTERDSTLDLAADWAYRLCRILLNLWDLDSDSKCNS